jgi:hypothetical protein
VHRLEEKDMVGRGFSRKEFTLYNEINHPMVVPRLHRKGRNITLPDIFD